MKTLSITAALAAVLAASTSTIAVAEPVFNRVASFAVADNLPTEADKKTVTSAEIIAGKQRTLKHVEPVLPEKRNPDTEEFIHHIEVIVHLRVVAGIFHRR